MCCFAFDETIKGIVALKYALHPQVAEDIAQNGGFLSFNEGLVFGFDIGTGSIGYAVRKGSQFLDVGVLICDSEGSDLSKRRDLRRSRRTALSLSAMEGSCA